jgi:hypothetical protein
MQKIKEAASDHRVDSSSRLPEREGESAQHQRADFYGAKCGMDPDELGSGPI